MIRIVPLLLVITTPLCAAEPWADQRLPESARTGLLLWLDAAVQNSARKALNKPELQSGAVVDSWFDGSGHARHLTQDQQDARPTFRDHGPGHSLLFDGDNDALRFIGGPLETKAATVFVVAAPMSNPGEFSGLFAAHEPGKNDYVTGLNLDQGPFLTADWSTINAEGRGFGGFQNLLDRPVAFGTLHIVSLIVDNGPDGVRLFFDGRLAGKRSRAAGPIRLDQIAVGARLYNNANGPITPSGFFDGDIAELLVFDQALSDDARQVVEKYLKEKYANVNPAIVARSSGPGTKPLVAVKDPPPVQMFVPGFEVHQLPLDLTNINNVRYRPDGKMLAVAYDGNVYLLHDTNGDGLEDKATLFWKNKGEIRAPIGCCLTPPGYKHGNGIFVACKGKVSLLVDRDGDDVADKEIIVAQGWKEAWVNVDALGVAIDNEENIYFGLGTWDFSNGYQIDKEGKPRVDLKDEHGTILRVSSDFQSREIVCTGIRFPVGLAFNRHGDLFATDQEGATWLPNGNPFDELLHIRKGRHYGFPPRHPRHLPNVIDEPSTFDYGPQHQSTCGFCFNESVNGGPVFGPSWWAGDAIVTGESRGKIYRTKLSRTPSGYVAQNQMIACLNMLTVDVCVSPRGELVVACHSGPPDWGTGPAGKGKLYKIRYSGNDEPQPVLAWAAGPGEVRIAFDRPLDPARLEGLARRTAIDQGTYVRAGDRFESLRPPYAVVQQQLRTPRHELPVLAASISPDRRTLILTTAPMRKAHHYAIAIADWRTKADGMPQHLDLDLDVDLSGVMAQWQGEDGSFWNGWLPHLDLAVSREFTAGSSEHDDLWKKLDSPGTLTLRPSLNLWQMLRPAVQPGSKIDHTWPPEQVTVTFRSNSLVSARTSESVLVLRDGAATLGTTPEEGKSIAVELQLRTGPALILEVAFATNEDQRTRPLALHRFMTPWAELTNSPRAIERAIAELKDGNWRRGREIFFGNEAQCSKCHTVNGTGAAIGPDLSNLIHRDYSSVLRDIQSPSAAINPDYFASIVELTDGRMFSGIVRRRGNSMVLVDGTAKETTFAAEDVEAIRHSPTSMMPEGMDKALGPDKLRDLLTFLLTEPLQPAEMERPGEPPPRSRAEIEEVLRTSAAPAGSHRKLHMLLAAGPKDHGPGEHDYPLWRRRWTKLFDLAENVVVSECEGFPRPELLAKVDVVVFYSNNPGWNADRSRELEAFLNRGGGAVFIHYAVNGHKHFHELAHLIGLAWGPGSRFRHGPLELSFPPSSHPITQGFSKLRLIDESYWNMAGNLEGITLLASGPEEGQARPLLWCREQGKGRVFVSIPGHYNWSFDDPLFRLLLLRGIAWSAGEPVDRFRELIWPGARVMIR